jgi:hypothetical protein
LVREESHISGSDGGCRSEIAQLLGDIAQLNRKEFMTAGAGRRNIAPILFVRSFVWLTPAREFPANLPAIKCIHA